MAVYFIQAENTEYSNLIKIGYTRRADLNQRLYNLQLMCPVGLRVIGVVEDGDKELENQLHWRFSKNRVYGEWFKPSLDLINFIEQHTTKINVVKLTPKRCEFVDGTGGTCNVFTGSQERAYCYHHRKWIEKHGL